jgi:hypothetical protein
VDEAVLGFNTIVGRNVTINTQTGNDLVLLGAAATTNGGMIGGFPAVAFNDPLGIGDTIGMAVGNRLRINTHSGADAVFMSYTAANSAIDIQLDKGPDFCTLWGVTSNTSLNVFGHSSEKKALVDAVFGLNNPAASGIFSPSIKTKYAILV